MACTALRALRLVMPPADLLQGGRLDDLEEPQLEAVEVAHREGAAAPELVLRRRIGCGAGRDDPGIELAYVIDVDEQREATAGLPIPRPPRQVEPTKGCSLPGPSVAPP